MQCGGRIAYHDGFQALFVQYPGQREECGARVHAAKLIVRLPMSGRKTLAACVRRPDPFTRLPARLRVGLGASRSDAARRTPYRYGVGSR